MTGDDGWGPVERGGGNAGPTVPPAPPRAPEPRDPGGFGPVQRGRARPRLPTPGRTDPGAPPRPARGTPRRWGRGLVAAVLGVILVTAGTATALGVYTSSQITRVAVGGLSGGAGQMNVLVVGNDSRAGLTGEELQELGTEAIGGERTDTIFLLSISGGRAAMLAFPRDLLVTRCDGSRGRINGAYAQGGPACMADTVTQLSGIALTHYVEVNFLGFIQIVDAVGGVSVFFDEPFVDRPAGIDLPAGCLQLNGRQAIGYVRARTAGGDLGRIARQQRFVAELAAEVTQPSTLLNPVRLFSVGAAAGQSVTASENLGTLALLRLARAGRGFAGAGLATYTVPADPARVGGAAVLVPDDAEAEALFAQFRDGTVLRPAPEPDAGPAEPEAVPAPEPVPEPEAPDAAPAPPDC